METVQYKTDRALYPWWKKYPGLIALIAGIYFLPWWGFLAGYLVGSAVSGFWWMANDEDADKGFVFRYIRNNSMNFKRFVLGVADRDHWVTGKAPATTVMRSDLKERGWQYTVIWLGPFPMLPFLSYSGPVIEWYVGWQPWGELAFKLTRADGEGWQFW